MVVIIIVIIVVIIIMIIVVILISIIIYNNVAPPSVSVQLPANEAVRCARCRLSARRSNKVVFSERNGGENVTGTSARSLAASGEAGDSFPEGKRQETRPKRQRLMRHMIRCAGNNKSAPPPSSAFKAARWRASSCPLPPAPGGPPTRRRSRPQTIV